MTERDLLDSWNGPTGAYFRLDGQSRPLPTFGTATAPQIAFQRWANWLAYHHSSIATADLRKLHMRLFR